jgi:putative acetyltransferase
MVRVRKEQPDDIGAVRAINDAAFGQSAEAQIVDALRAKCPEALSLVAVDEEQIVGHIFFSPVSVSCDGVLTGGMGLAPMAVAPDRQRQGIGSRLVRAGIRALRERGCRFIIVVGHPDYYPRFGFVPASRFGLTCQWDGVPDEAFLVLVLDDSVIPQLTGTAAYRDEFDAAM